MTPKNPYISIVRSIILPVLLGLCLSGCGSDSDTPAATSDMSVSFRVETRAGEQGNDGSNNSEPTEGYEDATQWENYIDITNGDYKIAFFDNSNKCISTFIPQEISAVENRGYVDYTLKGKIPGVLTFYSDFKIVVLANWGEYPEMKSGVTSIDDICCPQNGVTGQFQHFAESAYEIGDGKRYVPMFGVKEYTGVIFGKDNEDNPTVLYQGNFGPVNMLRAIAKVEVIFDTEDSYVLDETKSISITNYNDYGYCAPENTYLEKHYYNKNWTSDYRQGHLHLVGGSNDSGADKPLAMIKTKKGKKEVWLAYLPEYRNVAMEAGNKDCKKENLSASLATEINKARIAVPLIRGGNQHTAYIDFANYVDGEPDTPINIERNNLYRFTVTHVDNGVNWKVEVLQWNCREHEEIVM